MRNLFETQRSLLDVSEFLAPDARISGTCWDTATDSLICAYRHEVDDRLLKLDRINIRREVEPITSWTSVSPDGTPDCIRSIHHFCDTVSTCVVFGSGTIVLVREDPEPSVEIVGDVEDGIVTAQWSPDDEVLAFCTHTRSLLLMTRELDPIQEMKLTNDDLKASHHVSVGWGKAETQFQGKHAKAMRDPTVPEKVDRGVLSERDSGEAVITWRGDGAYLAISTIDNNERRVIRVLTREGVLESVSEPVDGLESPLSWRPVGNVIAGIRKLENTVEAVFFERNGLRHGDFTVPFNSEPVTGLSWNSDSTVLAITFIGRVQFWCMGNYHWYLKQEILLRQTVITSGMQWHPEAALQFHIATDSILTSHSFCWRVAAGSNIPPNDLGLVGVVDGRNVLLTPMRRTNIPPPMSYCQAELPNVPYDICISENGRFLAAIHAQGVSFMNLIFKKFDRSPTLNMTIASIDATVYYRQICFVGEATLCILGENRENCSFLRLLRLNASQSIETDEIFYFKQFPSVSHVQVVDNGRLVCQDQAGAVFHLNLIDQLETLQFTLPGVCPTMVSSIKDEQVTAFSLSVKGRLYANDRLLASACTSMELTDKFLIFTTSQHFIKFIHLTANHQDLDIPEDCSTADERCRSIERGARLVCVMPTKFSLVLQMPRGNLETIYPRALVLSGVRKRIASKDYGSAFFACRDNRVDLNILHDYAPHQFLESIDQIVKQLGKAEHIDLVLSQLRAEDVTRTMYFETGGLKSSGPSDTPYTSGIDKVNRICTAFIDYFKRHIQPSNVTNLVTAYVCKTPPDNQSALQLIASLRGREEYELAIKHICFLSDVNKLYNTALGIYDLELSLVLAQQAQKDPREYLPFLQKLQELSELERRYVINNKLRRFAEALKNLKDMGPEKFSEAQKYIVSKTLFSEGLHLFRHEPEELKTVTRAYADYLTNESRHHEAGLAYEFLEDAQSAIQAYEKSGHWQECLSMATQFGMPKDAFQDLCNDLVTNLCESKDYVSAAKIHLDHLYDVEEAARLFCQGGQYSEAIRLVLCRGKPDLLATVIDSSLVEGFATTSELLADCKGQCAAQASRVEELRKIKLEDPLAYLDGITEAEAPDNVSLAPTNASTSASLFTRYTGNTLATAMTGETRKTSKNRRREERKRARGKKGSVYEEEYLLNSLRRLVERVDLVRPDTQRLIECLFRRQMRQNAVALQSQLKELTGDLERCMKEVFEASTANSVADGEQEAKKEIVPIIRPFEGISLL